jgi:hypothetical protein
MTREILNVELADYLPLGGEGKNEMEDGARSDVQVTCGLQLWRLENQIAPLLSPSSSLG